MNSHGPRTRLLFLGLILACTARQASANTIINVTVAATAQPWNWSAGGLNTAYQFGLNNGSAPVVVSTANGFAFTPGDLMTVTWLSGSVANNGSLPLTDANGNLLAEGDNFIDPSNSTYLPSKYMSGYPIYGQQLVGTFADGSGSILGTPFALGDGPINLTVPTGAVRLQLGNNDTGYADNVGSWLIQVSGTSATPEPGTLILMASGGLIASLGRRRQRG